MRGLCSLIALVSFVAPIPGAEPVRFTQAGLQHFEQKIRPVLLKHCYSCHSTEAKKSRGGLLVDTRAALLKGGDSGPAIVPGKPIASLLLKALRHDGLAMPPKERLSATIVADFEKWIVMGAPDPRDGKPRTPAAGIDLVKARQFWSFQSPQKHAAPTVRDIAWPRTSVDRFLLAALEAKNLRPTRDADRLTLHRRVTIDLTGLPPTPEEVSAFLADTRPDAYERLVDSLLASAAFGERWGRHWLDVARYADSNGKDENLTFHEAFLYRDYIIRSFNADKPFAQLVREQIAGDLLPASNQAQREEQLTGSGFLVLGPKVLADRNQVRRRMDVIDEQIDTVGKTFLGLTLGCARCHDHKFDPVSTMDYYALAGIFHSTRTLDSFKLGNPVVSGWMLRPLDAESEKRLAGQKTHAAKLKKLTDQIRKAKADLKLVEDRATMRVPSRLAGIVVDNTGAKTVGFWKSSTYSRPYVGKDYIHDDKAGKGMKSVLFTPTLPKAGVYEVLLSYTPNAGRANNVPVLIKHADGETTVKVNQQQKPTIDGLFRKLGTYTFEAGMKGSVTISTKGTTGHVIVDAVRFVPVGALKETEPAMGVPAEVKERLASAKKHLADLEAEEKKLKASSPPTPRLVMAVRDEEKIGDIPVAIRGNAEQPGEIAPRRMLSVTPWKTPSVTKDQSGRRELAEWMVDHRNPLTARVFVNRVWSHLFGEGLVRSMDNFGTQGTRPSHPELLDTLATEFMEQDWSVKTLIRKLVLSRAYQLSTEAAGNLLKADPENRLLGRAHRRRLQAEVLRDAILSVSGQLDRRMGGSAVAGLGERAIDNSSKGGVNVDRNTRRSVYLPVIRNDLPAIFEVFDFADPDVTVGRRDATTVPTQALYLMNSPFILDQARATADRLLSRPVEDPARIATLYQLALGRKPSSEEVRRAVEFVQAFRQDMKGRSAEQAEREAWAGLAQVMFSCTEFRFVE